MYLFDIGVVAEPGIADASFRSAVAAVIPFAVHQELDHLIGRKTILVAIFKAGLEGPGHAVQLHLLHSLQVFFIHTFLC